MSRTAKVAENPAPTPTELESFVRTLPVIAVLLDVHHRILAVSGAWSEVFRDPNHPQRELIYDELLGERLDLRPLCAEAIERNQSPPAPQIIIPLPDGSSMIAEAFVRPWYTEAHEVGGTLIVLNDITELQRARERTESLSDQLMQFNYRISHNFIAPLRTIRGYLNICSDELGDRAPAMVTELHEQMAGQVDELSTLIRDLMTITRSEVDDNHRDIVDLAEIIQICLASHDKAISESKINVRCSLGVDTVRASKCRLLQITDSLISNAVKYCDPRNHEKRIEIASFYRGNDVVITVTDNGIGFPKTLQDNIFDLFFRGSSLHPGNGLGLYLVRKNAEKLGGYARVVALQPTVFEVSLPAAPQPIALVNSAIDRPPP